MYHHLTKLALFSMTQLRSLTLNGRASHVTNDHAKFFYQELARNAQGLQNLNEVTFQFSESVLQKEVAITLARAL
jgi:hypothetical protein